MEELKGIRKGKGKKVRKKQRATFLGWSFSELRQFITCKAQAAGVPIVFVNPDILLSVAAIAGPSRRQTENPHPNSSAANAAIPPMPTLTRRSLSKYWGFAGGPMVVRMSSLGFNRKLSPSRRLVN
jgi:hypothetical protein